MNISLLTVDLSNKEFALVINYFLSQNWFKYIINIMYAIVSVYKINILKYTLSLTHIHLEYMKKENNRYKNNK